MRRALCLFLLAVGRMIWVHYEMRNDFRSIRWNLPPLKFINVLGEEGEESSLPSALHVMEIKPSPGAAAVSCSLA